MHMLNVSVCDCFALFNDRQANGLAPLGRYARVSTLDRFEFSVVFVNSIFNTLCEEQGCSFFPKKQGGLFQHTRLAASALLSRYQIEMQQRQPVFLCLDLETAHRSSVCMCEGHVWGNNHKI